MTTEELTAKLQQFDRQLADLAQQAQDLPEDSPMRVVIAADMAILNDRFAPIMAEALEAGVSLADLADPGSYPAMPETDSDQS